MNGPIKLAVPLVAALAIAACNAGGSSNVPGMSGTSLSDSSRFGQPVVPLHVPDWQAQHQARPACPQVIGKPTCLVLVSTQSKPGQLVAGLAPADFQKRYNLPSNTKGSGQTVAIIDWGDDPDATADLATYRNEFSLGTANFTKYNAQGKQSGYPSSCTEYGSCVEIMLDIEMVSAVCPKCTIDLIEAENSISSLEQAETEAATLGAHIVSNSWICYGSNNCGDSNFGNFFDTKGVLYLASSGDEGYNQNGAPEALGSVVSVGGTTLVKNGTGYTETVWNGAGGGCATGVTKPTWQHDPGCTSRTDSDVSAVACICVAEYDELDGGWFEVGGTSVASPMNAGIFALAGNASSQDAGKKFWSLKGRKLKKDLHAITSGSDGSCCGSYLCEAGTKQFKTYSGPAGWGTPNGIKAY